MVLGLLQIAQFKGQLVIPSFGFTAETLMSISSRKAG